MEEITFETFMNWLDGFFVQSAVEGILAIILVLIVTLFCWKIAKKIIRKHLVNKNLDIILNITKNIRNLTRCSVIWKMDRQANVL